VLSPSTAQNDTGRKFAAYELHGVQEYWILDPIRLEHRFYCRVGDVLEEFATQDETVRSFALLGFWLKRAWLNPAKTPTVASCRAAIRKSERGSRR
jgi:Uma2 family endonuclease